MSHALVHRLLYQSITKIDCGAKEAFVWHKIIGNYIYESFL